MNYERTISEPKMEQSGTLDEVDNSAWLNADFMRTFEEKGTPVQIKEGETLTVTLPRIFN